MDVLQCVAQIIKRLHGPWILAADFNFSPDALRRSGWLRLVDGQIHAPDEPTCNSNVYDYFVVDRRLQQSVIGVAVVNDTGAGPHYAVRLWMRGKPRSHRIRVLRQPEKADPSPPQGCLPEEAYLGWEDLAATEVPGTA